MSLKTDNNVCREEDSLVDMFTFEILVVFVESLAIAHSDDKSLGQCLKNAFLVAFS